MKTNNRIAKAEYIRYFSIIANAKDQKDFIERTKLLSNLLIEELANRLSTNNAVLPFQAAEIITGMNEDIVKLITNINAIQVVKNQPEISLDAFINLIKMNNKKLFIDYEYATKVYQN